MFHRRDAHLPHPGTPTAFSGSGYVGGHSPPSHHLAHPRHAMIKKPLSECSVAVLLASGYRSFAPRGWFGPLPARLAPLMGGLSHARLGSADGHLVTKFSGRPGGSVATHQTYNPRPARVGDVIPNGSEFGSAENTVPRGSDGSLDRLASRRRAAVGSWSLEWRSRLEPSGGPLEGSGALLGIVPAGDRQRGGQPYSRYGPNAACSQTDVCVQK